MPWSITLTVVDCVSTTPLSGASVWVGSEYVASTDANGQVVIVADDQSEWLVLRVAGPASPTYVTKNLMIQRTSYGTAQTVCLAPLGCFTGETWIALAEGGPKPIAALQVGDRVLGHSAQPNSVTAIHRSHLGHRKLYAVNGSAPFVTGEHPFVTANGWKAAAPDASVEESLNDRVGRLDVTDTILRLDDRAPAANPSVAGAGAEPALVHTPVVSVEGGWGDAETPLYNLTVDGDHTFIANGFLVHNKSKPITSCFIATAATGSSDSAEVWRLRQLRDRVCTASRLAARLIDEIYREYAQISPPIAANLRRDARSRESVLGIAVRPLLAWYGLAATLALEPAQASAATDAAEKSLHACRSSMPPRAMVGLLEAVRAGTVPAGAAHPLLLQLAPRLAHLPLASWAVVDPLVRVWRSIADSSDLVAEVAGWLVNTPLDALVPSGDPESRKAEIEELARFFAFRPSLRPRLGQRLMKVWPDAADALEQAGFVPPSRAQRPRCQFNSIVDYLKHWAATQPEKHFASFLDVDGRTTESYTFREFCDRTRRVAAHLRHHSHIKRGDRVLLVYPPGLEVIVAFVACARVGAIPVPLQAPTATTSVDRLHKLRFTAHDCEATVALTNDAFYRSYGPPALRRDGASQSNHAPVLPDVEWLATDAATVATSAECPDDPGSVLFLQYTSGSTSEPKGVIVTHQNVIHNARSTIDHVPVGVSWLPQHHDMGLIGYYLHPLVMGGSVYGFSPSDFLRRPVSWLKTISRVRATYASAPNFGFEYCLREDKVAADELTDVDLTCLRVLLNGSEPARGDTYLRFLKRFAPYGLRPEAHVVAYGLAENTLAATHYGRRVVTVNRRLLRHGHLRIEQPYGRGEGQMQLLSCGKPLDGIDVRIVDPELRTVQPDGTIGEIWICGKSVCHGYWGRPDLTNETFHNLLPTEGGSVFLRSGDLGFMDNGELFVCGRIKDVIIVRGVKYYPDDIEAVVESSLEKVRVKGVAAFNCDVEGASLLVIVVEVRTRTGLPSPDEIARTVRKQCGIDPDAIVFAAAPAVARTSSGKISRGLTRQRWQAGELRALATYRKPRENTSVGASSAVEARIRHLLAPYNVTGREQHTLGEIGLDSLGFVTLTLELERLFQRHDLGRDFDVRLLQRLTVAEFFSLLGQFDGASSETRAALKDVLTGVREEQDRSDLERMRSDARLNLVDDRRPPKGPVENVLLTGPTGFFGPFLLASLLRQTRYAFYVLMRAGSAADGMERIRSSLRRAQVWSPALDIELRKRVHVVCGDISQPNLGLDPLTWTSLSNCTQAVFHNAARVNYTLDYSALRPHNVLGTRELLRFAFTGAGKEFHFVSSTIIFGWTAKATVFETDNNVEMEKLEFGYAQSKWVAEQLVFAAGKQGLDVRVYRPSFLTASTRGVSSKDDIVVRLLAFMINHGIAVDARNQVSFLPADVAADDIVGLFRHAPSSDGAGGTFHLTVDDYYNMVDVVGVIAEKYGFQFRYYDIPSFVEEMKRRCTKEDLIYPLIDFFVASQHRMVAMQHKRYDNQGFRQARNRCARRSCDPRLEETVSYIMKYLVEERLVQVPGKPQ